MPCQTPYRGDTSQMLLWKIASCLADGGFVSGVSSFNGFTGAVTFTGADIITLLGCTPACEGDVVNSFNGQTGDVTLTLGDVTTALGFTPLSQAAGDARYVLKTGDSMTGALSINNGTLAVASAPALSLAQTWNNGAVTFTGLLQNVTNTASSTNSNLLNFQVGAEDRFNYTVGGTFRNVKHDATNSGISYFMRKRGATGDADAAVADGSSIGTIFYSGWDGAAFQTGGQFAASVEGVWSGTNRGLQLSFQVTPTGTITAVTALTLNGGVAGVTVGRAIRFPYVAKTATYTITEADYTVDCTANSFTVNLPTAVGITGRVHVIKNSGVGTITIDPSGAQTIDGLATSPVISGAAAMIQSDGANWIII